MQGPASLHLFDDSLSMPSPSVDLKDSASCTDLDVIVPHTTYDNRLGYDLGEPQFDNHLVEEDQGELTYQGAYDNQEDFPDEDTLVGDQDLDCGDKHTMLPLSLPTEDDMDPFLVEQHPGPSIANVSELPSHLVTIYAIVSWLYMQFNLPHVAYNAVLTMLACLVTFFNLQFELLFITLPSITCALAINPSIKLLPVCLNCQDVFPLVALQHMQDTCISCKVPLFLPSHMNQGILHNAKTPVIKYPYLPLLQQLVSVLKIPSIKVLLDG